MSGISCLGAWPRASGRVLLAGVIVGGSMLAVVSSASAGEREFRGQLSYETFQRAARRNETVRVTYSPGGTGAAALALARVSNVVIDGACNSACAWAFVRNPGACFTKRASFGFHAAHDPGTGRRLNAATQYWLASVRGSLRGRLDVLLTSSRLVRVSAHEMRQYYGDRACGAAPRTELAAAKPQKPTVVAALAPVVEKAAARKVDKATQRVAKLEVASHQVREAPGRVPRIAHAVASASRSPEELGLEMQELAAAVTILSHSQLEAPADSFRPSLWAAATGADTLEPAMLHAGLLVASSREEATVPGLHVAGIEADGEAIGSATQTILFTTFVPFEGEGLVLSASAAAVCWEAAGCSHAGIVAASEPAHLGEVLASGPEIWLAPDRVARAPDLGSPPWPAVVGTAVIASAEVLSFGADVARPL